MFCSIYAFQTDCSAHGTYCIVHSFHRVQPSVCSLYEFHTEYTAVCPSFTLGALKAVGVPHWVYCCMSLFTLAILHIFTLWKPYVFTLSVLQSVRILFALSVILFTLSVLQSVRVLKALQSVRVSHWVHCSLYVAHTELTAACPLFHLVCSVFSHFGVLKAVLVPHRVCCSLFVFYSHWMLVTLSALQSVRVSHRVYCSLSVISLGALRVCTLWCIESRAYRTLSVLQSIRVFQVSQSVRVSHWLCCSLSIFHTVCISNYGVNCSLYVFTLTVLQSVRVSHRAYFKLRSLLQSVRVPRWVYTTVYVFQTARGMAGP